MYCWLFLPDYFHTCDIKDTTTKQRQWKFGRPLSLDEENSKQSEQRYKRSSFSMEKTTEHQQQPSNNADHRTQSGEVDTSTALNTPFTHKNSSKIKNIFKVDTELDRMREERRLARQAGKKGGVTVSDSVTNASYTVSTSSMGNSEQPSRIVSSSSSGSDSKSPKNRHEEVLKERSSNDREAREGLENEVKQVYWQILLYFM